MIIIVLMIMMARVMTVVNVVASLSLSTRISYLRNENIPKIFLTDTKVFCHTSLKAAGKII